MINIFGFHTSKEDKASIMKESAGILLYRLRNNQPEFFLIHAGGPFFTNRDKGWWSIPKGEPEENEAVFKTALREFQEETGYLPTGEAIPLTHIRQKGGKGVSCWGMKGDLDPEQLQSNTFQMEWPPKSGKLKEFQEIDRGAWFNATEAREKINQKQMPLIDELLNLLNL